MSWLFNGFNSKRSVESQLSDEMKCNPMKWNAASFFLKRFVWIVDWGLALLLTNGDGALRANCEGFEITWSIWIN